MREHYKLPRARLGSSIPRVIYQKYSRGMITPAVSANINRLRSLNPDYHYKAFNDEEAEDFVCSNFDPSVAETYKTLDHRYAAARADLFRYLLIYQLGGVYLDLKSTITRPLSSSLNPDDLYILSQWNHDSDSRYKTYGLHQELADAPGGEYQQWFLISAPHHPYLSAVIETVIANIWNYRPWRDATGRLAVLRTTDPIPYTQAIRSVINEFPHRLVRHNESIGFLYSFNPDERAHTGIGHYWHNRHSLTRRKWPLSVPFALYGAYMRFANSYKVDKLTKGWLPLNRER